MSIRLRHVRTALLVVAVSLTVADFWMHGGTAPWRSPLRAAAAATSPNHPPICGEMTGIAPVLLNANLPYPHALNVRSGSISPGETAKFFVFALTGTPEYANVTAEFLSVPHDRAIGTVRVKPAPGSRSVAGRLHVTQDPGVIWIEYRPKREVPLDRTAIFTLTFNCGPEGGPYTAQFVLTITGLRSAGSTGS
jgi:hypothetical protein